MTNSRNHSEYHGCNLELESRSWWSDMCDGYFVVFLKFDSLLNLISRKLFMYQSSFPLHVILFIIYPFDFMIVPLVVKKIEWLIRKCLLAGNVGTMNSFWDPWTWDQKTADWFRKIGPLLSVQGPPHKAIWRQETWGGAPPTYSMHRVDHTLLIAYTGFMTTVWQVLFPTLTSREETKQRQKSKSSLHDIFWQNTITLILLESNMI